MDESVQSDAAATIGVPRETVEGERRVALVPDLVAELTGLGLSVAVETGAGDGAFFGDEAYRDAGATIVPEAGNLLREANVVVKVQPPQAGEVEKLHAGTILVSFLDPSRSSTIVQALEARGVTAFSFNVVPRITRAQSMDAMSAMSTVAGYKAVLLAAGSLPRFFPLLMTAAGTVAPARVVVIGAGVAGLQALATARRLGAVTAACDARPAVREQIQSVGATFIDMSVQAAEGEGGYAREMDEEYYRLERDAIREPIKGADVVISTALVPGAAAPMLIDEDMIRGMRPGSVVVDLAAEAGGNCELTVPGETAVRHGVSIMGPLNLASTLPAHASQMYARNVVNVVKLIVQDGRVHLDFEDEIISSACVTGKPAAATTAT
jgi:NAD(P) transhydrogenase subunit alpha